MHRPIDLKKKKKEAILLRAIVIPRSQAWMIHLNLSFKGTKLARFIIYHSNSSNSILINHSATRVQITRDSKNKIKRWNEKGGYKKKNITRRGRSTYLFRSLRFSKRVHLDIETSRERRAIKITRLFVDTVELRHGKLTFRRWRGRLSWNFNRLGAPFLPRPSQSRREYRELTVKCFFTNKLAKSWQRARAPPNLC